MVIGPGGSGKSRLADRLGEVLGFDVIRLDLLFWKPGWQETDALEWEESQRSAAEADSWIVDGLHESTMHIWLEAADTLVFLDLSPLVCVWRVTRRRLDSDAPSEVPAGCEPAPFHRALAKFLFYQWEYRTRIRGKILSSLDLRRDDATVVVLRSGKEADAFVQTVSARGQEPAPA